MKLDKIAAEHLSFLDKFESKLRHLSNRSNLSNIKKWASSPDDILFFFKWAFKIFNVIKLYLISDWLFLLSDKKYWLFNEINGFCEKFER
jgi:hypothetical protein